LSYDPSGARDRPPERYEHPISGRAGARGFEPPKARVYAQAAARSNQNGEEGADGDRDQMTRG
jgi:hypothetical protein